MGGGGRIIIILKSSLSISISSFHRKTIIILNLGEKIIFNIIYDLGLNVARHIFISYGKDQSLLSLTNKKTRFDR